jgi:hypothetical protein
VSALTRFSLLFLVTSLSGCGLFPVTTDSNRAKPLHYNESALPPQAGPLKRVVVENFENKSAFDDRGAVAQTREAFVEALHRSMRVVLVTPQELLGQTREARLADAKAKGINVVVFGTVLDISSRQSGDPVGIVRSVQLTTTATVQLVAVSTDSKQELFNQTETAQLSSQSTKVAERSSSARYAEQNPYLTHQAIQAGFSRLIEGLLASLNKIHWQGRIAMIEGERIFVNAGKMSGLQPGDILRVSEQGKEVYDATTGELLGHSPGRIKGTLEVISYFGKDGAVTLIHSGSGFNENDIVELY